MKSIKSNCRKVSCAFGCAAVIWLAGAFSAFAEPIAPSDDAAANTATIQAAIDAAVSAGGGVVELDEGLFPLTNRITVGAGVTLRGQGYEKTVLKQGVSNKGVLTVTGASSNRSQVEKLTITGGRIDGNGAKDRPSGVQLNNYASLSYCMVSNNFNSLMNSAFAGGVHVAGSSVIIDHTIVRNNRHGFRLFGGGIRVMSGSATIDTCLIADNGGGGDNGQGSGAGIYCDVPTVLLNSTIAHNEITYTSAANAKGGGAYFAKTCYVTNCIFAANIAPKCDSTGKPNWAGTTPVGANNFFGDGSATFGDNPQSAPTAGFRDMANGDYSLTAISGAKGQGFWYDDIPEDITGAERKNPPDIGCYAYDASKEPFSCPVKMLNDKAFVDQPVGFKVELVNPPDGGEFTYIWTLTDQFGNTRSLADSAEPNEVIPAAGFYTVSLEVKDLNSPATANYTIPETLHIAVRTNYVTSVKEAVPVYPYDTPEKATTSLNAAIVETIDGSTVILDEGTHNLTATVELDKEVSVLGAGRDKTTVDAKGHRAFYLHHEKAFVEDLGITGGGTDTGSSGSAVSIDGAGGTVRRCRMFNNSSIRQNGTGDTLILGSNLALVENCVISNNTGTVRGGGDSAIVSVCNGILRNTLIANNRCSYKDKTVGIDCSVVRVGGSGTLENCTVVSNRTVGTGNISVALYLLSGATVRNTIISDNVAENNVLPETEYISVPNWASAVKASTLTTVSNCAVGDGCATLGANPADGGKILFKDAANGDWHLQQGSSCIGKGLNAKWMETAVDLDGRPRLQGRRVDLGCYEADPLGLVILIY